MSKPEQRPDSSETSASPPTRSSKKGRWIIAGGALGFVAASSLVSYSLIRDSNERWAGSLECGDAATYVMTPQGEGESVEVKLGVQGVDWDPSRYVNTDPTVFLLDIGKTAAGYEIYTPDRQWLELEPGYQDGSAKPDATFRAPNADKWEIDFVPHDGEPTEVDVIGICPIF